MPVHRAQKLSISRAQPLPTCSSNECCPHQKHYARGRINHRCINSYNLRPHSFFSANGLSFLVRKAPVTSVSGSRLKFLAYGIRIRTVVICMDPDPSTNKQQKDLKNLNFYLQLCDSLMTCVILEEAKTFCRHNESHCGTVVQIQIRIRNLEV